MTASTKNWDIDELAARTAEALTEAGVDQESQRVTTAPSPRTIRYYATHGLVDKPSDFDGRTALYGRTHLLQLLAIKRLQARGYTLDEIQQRLAGARREELRQIAGWKGDSDSVDGDSDAGDSGPARQQARATGEAMEAFWTAAPTEEDTGSGRIAGLKLEEAVRLVLDEPERTLDSQDVEAIRAAAAPLLKVLKKRGIID